jgi:hypothetical protein
VQEPVSTKPEESCPIRGTHTRLHRCHTLWHQAQREYSNPEEFCTNLNSTIQALRTVTWILQKEHDAIPDFDPWYAAWQERMRDDPVMKWLVEARNRIEKQGDLKTYSSARLSVLADWDGPYPIVEAEVDPLLSTQEIPAKLPELDVPPGIRREGVLIIERRWVARDLREHELLDALAHCYGVLATIVIDAHRRCGFVMRTFKAESHEGKAVRTEHLEGRLPCMVATAAARSVRIHLPTGEVLNTAEFIFKPDPRRMEEAAKRYGFSEGDVRKRQPGEDVITSSAWWFDSAKRVLATDAYHDPIVLLETADGGAELHGLDIPDRASLYVQMQKLADQVERIGAVGLIHIGEFWAAPAEDLKPGQQPSELASRKEVLQVTAATADGRNRVHSVEFSKTETGKIEFGTEWIDDTPEPVGFLEPVRRVWRRWAAQRQG